MIIKHINFGIALAFISISFCASASNSLILIGDSITAAAGEANIGTCKVINLAQGGIGVAEALTTSEKVKINVDASLISIGINDTKKNKLSNQDLFRWENQYKKLVKILKEKSKAVYLSTILPTEADKTPYGDYSDSQRLQLFNSKIKTISSELRVNLIDSNEYFLSNFSNFTSDGVHLKENYTGKLLSNWAKNIRECK